MGRQDEVYHATVGLYNSVRLVSKFSVRRQAHRRCFICRTALHSTEIKTFLRRVGPYRHITESYYVVSTGSRSGHPDRSTLDSSSLETFYVLGYLPVHF